MPDAHELVHAGAAAEDGEVADRAMPGQHHVVGENDAVAHPAVVRHMAVDQERALVPHRCHAAAACSSGVHRDALADRAVRTDLQGGVLALELQVLRLGPERREREHARTRPDRRVAGNRNVADELDARPQHHVRPDHAEWPDLHIVGELRAIFDDSRGVRVRCSLHPDPGSWRLFRPPPRPAR